MNPDDVHNEILTVFSLLEKIPPEVHLFCPQLSDDDDTDYDNPNEEAWDGVVHMTAVEKKERLKNSVERRDIATTASLILGINKDEASDWLGDWTERAEKHLTSCANCIRAWQKNRKPFLQKLAEKFNEDLATIMEQKLNEFDKNRIDRGLARAEALLKKNGPMKTNAIAKQEASAVTALYEALCCMPYLALPENRGLFNFVFQEIQKAKRPLRLGTGVIPTMTFFLFQEDEDGLRSGFARAAWSTVPAESLTPDQFDWAVSEYLIREIIAVNSSQVSELRIKKFWEGISVMLPAMSPDFLVHTLRAMEVQPDIYHLAFNHLGVIRSDDVLVTLIKTLTTLLRKSRDAFWGAMHDINATILTQRIFGCQAFPILLSRSLDHGRLVKSGDKEVPLLSDFMKALMQSLQTAQRSDPCDSTLDQLLRRFYADQSREGKAVCTHASLVTLICTLEGLSDPYLPFSSTLVFIDITYNIVFKHKDFLIDCVSLMPGDRYNIGISDAALRVVDLALTLDSNTFDRESKAIRRGEKLSHHVQRRSAKLWDSFINHLQPSKTTSLANVIINATLPLRSVERFLPSKKDAVVKDPVQKQFNHDFGETAESIGRLIGRVSEFSRAELDRLSSDNKTLGALFGCLAHGEDSIRDAAIDFLKTFTDEDSRSDALEKILSTHSELFLRSFSDAVGLKVSPSGPSDMFAPVPNILVLYREMLDAITNSATGLLRRELSHELADAVRYWWKRQWVFLGHFFGQTRHWAENFVHKNDMEAHCRSAVEHADKLLAEDGLVANAIKALVSNQSRAADQSRSDATRAAAMKLVLEAPRASTVALFAMLQLRDQYLLDVFTKTVNKLIRRLNEFDMKLPPKPLQLLKDICERTKDGRFKMNSNLRSTQKFELMAALGSDGDSGDDDVQLVSESTAKTTAFKKQSSLEAWSKSGPSATSSTTTISKSTSEKAPSVLSALKAQAQQAQKPKPALLSAAAIKSTQSSLREARAKEQAERAKINAASVARAKALREAFNTPKTVAGEGSGLQGISGVLGKDHAPAKSEIMVGDSSEDEDGGEDDNMGDLFGEGQAGKNAAAQRLKQLAAKPVGPVKKTKIQRSVKDLRARITPPMERLHEAILEWDIFHEGNDPPNGYTCKEVAKSYGSPTDYRDTFFPLLVNEAWRSFVTSKDESTAKPFDIKIVTRASVDRFFEVTTSMQLPNKKENDRDRDRLSDGDIVLLSTAQDPLNSKESPHILARVWKTQIKKGILEITYRVASKSNGRFVNDHLSPGKDLRGLRITNMTTVEREYAALESLQYYDLMTEVLDAEPSPVLNFSDERIRGFQDNYQLNRGQAVAIINAKENDGFTLVQGPPGTGKTKTIIAMVGALLTGNMKIKPPAARVNNPRAVPSEEPMMRKLLVCAPSNAAVDELVLRLKQGVKDTHGETHKINVLRLGRSDAINAGVRDVTLDELVKQQMDALLNAGGGGSAVTDRAKLHKDAGEIKVKLASVREALEIARANNDHGQTNTLQREFDTLKKQQAQVGAQIDNEKASGNTMAREAEIKRRSIQQKILADAHVLCATLSGAGHDMFKTLQVEFETVIIDEAAQCVELSALIPLKYGASKCILVGDPKQLPPTVLSQSAARYGYDQSLFVRMQQNHPGKVHLLDCQYRMHPEISLYPSKEFYEGLLADGPDMAQLRRQPWHDNPMLGPYRFFDVEGVQERGNRGQSLVNNNEINVAEQLYVKFKTDFSSQCDVAGKIGIITPYKAQLHALKQRFRDKWGDGVLEDIEFNTTDAFQGRECEIIIFSCVRASPTGGIGFMTDIRRMNVGLTRARSSLWILGDSRALRQGMFWNKLIEDAKARDRYTSGQVVAQLRQSRAIKGSGGGYSGPAQTPISMPMSMPMGVKGGGVMMQRKSEDVEMVDINDVQARQQNHQPKVERFATAAPPVRSSAPDQPAPGQQPRATSQAPAIKSSADLPKKRPASEDIGGSPAVNKRNANSHGHQAPTGPKSMTTVAQRPAQPRPTDPSAMQALGLAPPQRPQTQNQPQAPRPPKKKGSANPFIQRKPNR